MYYRTRTPYDMWQYDVYIHEEVNSISTTQYPETGEN